MMNLPIRPRRNRKSANIRGLVRETSLSPEHLICPVFVHEGDGNQPISSLPGCTRWSVQGLVEEAKRRGLRHEEYHSKVEYLVAHGIASTVDEERVLIGSAHFVFEDEGCTVPPGEQAAFDTLLGQVRQQIFSL